MSLKKGFVSLFVLSIFFSCPAFAINEVNLNDDINSDAKKIELNKLVSSISYDDVLDKAIKHSYDLKMADFDVFIAKTGIKSARSEYFPKLYMGANSEYNKNFSDINTPTYIGDAYINPYTRFQSMFGLTLSYNVFDFGVRRGYLNIAKEDVELSKLLSEEQLQDLTLNIIDIFSRIYTLKKQIELNNKIIDLGTKNLEMKQRLYNAKELSKLELNEQIVQNKKISKRLYELKAALAENLNLLSFYTGENYDINNLQVQEFIPPSIDIFLYEDYTKSLVWDIHNIAISKKEQELNIVRRTNFPKLNMYSKYYLYDSNTNNYLKSLGLGPSNYSVGLSLNMPVFDGLKNSADIQKAKLELGKIYVERDKAIAELKNKIATLRTNYTYMDEQLKESSSILDKLNETEKNTNRMLSKGIVSPIDLMQAKIDVLEEQIEYEKNKTTLNSIIKAIQILTTYDKD